MSGIMVSQAVSSTDRVEFFAQHQPAGFLKPEVLLELQWAHRCNGFEMMVQPRDAHAQFVCEFLDPQWLVEILPKSFYCFSNQRGVAARRG
jgi:hypothetical protein